MRYLVSVGKAEAARAEVDAAQKVLAPEVKSLTLASCWELLGDVESAGDHLRAVLQEQQSAAAHQTLADFYVRVGQLAKADPLYRAVMTRKVSASDEEVAAARRGLALALVKVPHPATVAEALQLVGLKRDETGNIPETAISESLDEMLVQARVLGSLNHHRLRAQAVALLEGLQQKKLLQAEDQFFLARLMCQQGSDPAGWTRARTLLKGLLDHHPKNPRILAFTTHMHIQQKEFADAEQTLTRLEAVERERKTRAGGFGSIELKAKWLEARGLGAQAVVVLTDYASQPDAQPVRKLLLADLHGRLGQFREAIDLCDEVRKTGSGYYEAVATALAILRHNKPSEAQTARHAAWLEQRDRMETTLAKALEKDPKDIPVRLQLADLMELRGKHDEVERLCREVLGEDGRNLVALNNLAWMLGQHKEKAAEALTLINRAIEQHGTLPELLDTRAIVLLRLGNVEAATRDLERAVTEAPTPTRLFHLSRAYDRARNAVSAVALLRRANEMGLSLHHLHPAEQAEYQQAMAGLRKSGQ
jgi:Tfp pilus assembly protein PilF